MGKHCKKESKKIKLATVEAAKTAFGDADSSANLYLCDNLRIWSQSLNVQAQQGSALVNIENPVVSMSAVKIVNQPLSNTESTIIFEDASTPSLFAHNIGINYNITTGQALIPTKGIYSILLYTGLLQGSAGPLYVRLKIVRNGTTYTAREVTIEVPTEQHIKGIDVDLLLLAGDLVFVTEQDLADNPISIVSGIAPSPSGEPKGWFSLSLINRLA